MIRNVFGKMFFIFTSTCYFFSMVFQAKNGLKIKELVFLLGHKEFISRFMIIF